MLTGLRGRAGSWFVAGAVLVALATVAPRAEGQSQVYQRPGVTIVGLDLPSGFDAALTDYCALACANTMIGNRADINTLDKWAYQSQAGAALVNAQAKTWATGAPATIQAWLGTSGVTRGTILHLVNAESDYWWKMDTLAGRARYAITAEEAQRALRTQRGPSRREMAQVLPNYFFVFTLVAPQVTSSRSGSSTSYSASATVLGATYRLGYPDLDALVGGLLRPFSCFADDQPPCTESDRVARQQQFSRYEPPLIPLASFSAAASGTGSTEAQARRALMDDAFLSLVNKTADKDAAFKVRAPVVAGNPVAARIGLKEGVTRNSGRFVALSQGDSTPGRPVRMVRRGVFIANRVADNRRVVFTGSSGNARMADTTARSRSTFLQIHGGSVQPNRAISLAEKPYYGSFSVGAVNLASDTVDGRAWGVAAQFEYRLSLLPAGAYAGLGGAGFWSPMEVGSNRYPSAVAYRVGGLIGQELFPARGAVRLRIQVEGGKNLVHLGNIAGGTTSPDTVETGWYGNAAASLALAPSPYWNIFGTVQYLRNFPEYDYLTSGVGFMFGIRIEP